MCHNEHPRPLRIFNAGSSTELGRVRVFSHARGRLLCDPSWISARLDRAHSTTRPPAATSAIWGAVRAFSMF
jgi:hypothetical protein